ncbi:glycoside hydrolase family 2 protein [Fundicoccus sp. Sow4_H7]|uniref:glycoside hydrolase family 2 protein n=1 Tax=Fundicoccus sp. Sow4_H7 TaxID=3438784 RepID=UPI003F93C218
MKRNEYPRPQFVRENWLNLNGEWEFCFDDENRGMKEQWFKNNVPFDQVIQVPFVYQSKLSGIHDTGNHEIVWYRRTFTMPEDFTKDRFVLHFGAVDYIADVFVNGSLVGQHIGGHTSFKFDVSAYLDKDSDQQTITLRVFDPRKDERIPRGKQTWSEEPHSIWYTNSTGIWQTVWLENIAASSIEAAYFTPNIDNGTVELLVDLHNPKVNQSLNYTIAFKGEKVASGRLDCHSPFMEITISISQQQIFRTAFHHNGWYWTPETPNLFDVRLTLEEDGQTLDSVDSYFGMRKIHIEDGKTYLNNKPYYQKLVLDQGYWPESLMTAPSDEAFKKDIELSKAMGFNGARKHQKVEDPRFLYWADQMGYIVWGESASAHYFSKESISYVTDEWKEIVKRDYNHPSIVTWVPFNESWGIGEVARDRRQQHYTQALYHLLHALDTSRLVISNDGWEMTETDITAVHNYAHGQIDEVKKFEQFKHDTNYKINILASTSAGRPIYAEGFSYQDTPILLTEYGGIGYKVGEQAGWGYTSVTDEADFVSEYERVTNAVMESNHLFGFCYTQLYDVEQEINGLLTYDRQPKCPLEKIKAINSQYHSNNIATDDSEGCKC